MTENYRSAKRKAFKELCKLKQEVRRLSQTYNKDKNARFYTTAQDDKRKVDAKKAELKLKMELFNRTFNED